MAQRDSILKILESNRGVVVSGQQLADDLGITRAGVWKAIKLLQSNGYNITAKTNGGYVLQADNDIISLSAIEGCLNNNGDNIYVFETLDSTNNYAMKLAQDGVENGALVIAVQQTDGKGRIGKSFISPKGGIYMSMVLRPNCQLSEAMLITPMIAVAVTTAINNLCKVDSRIKWVNDIYLYDKKICGILTQAVTDFESGGVSAVVVGIGINFDTPLSAFDGELAKKATSIFGTEKPNVTKNQLIAEIYKKVMAGVITFGDRKFMQRYKELSFVIGRQITYEFNSKPFGGTAIDIDDNGRLVVQTVDGIIYLNCGEISIKI